VPSGAGVKSIEGLRGKRAAWVDPHSAAGYILARIELAAHGIGQRDLGTESVVGSHDAVVRAVAAGQADFGATYARITRTGEVTGAWSSAPGLAPSIEVLATFGEIPPDAIVMRPDLDPALRARVTGALMAMTREPADRALIADALGADTFHAPESAMYDAFRSTVFRAFREGVLDASAVEVVALLGPDATLDYRGAVPPDVQTTRTLPTDTQEADVIEVIDAAKKL
jgi:phosphonate transport system substrate-binding protein